MTKILRKINLKINLELSLANNLNKKIYVSRKTNNLPLIDFKISEGNVCLDGSPNITKGTTDYVLMEYIRGSCKEDIR